jgi:plastocyanin
VVSLTAVRWSWRTPGCRADKTWDSGRLPIGGTFSRPFAKPGTYDFVCTIHPAMHGTITVE